MRGSTGEGLEIPLNRGPSMRSHRARAPSRTELVLERLRWPPSSRWRRRGDRGARDARRHTPARFPASRGSRISISEGRAARRPAVGKRMLACRATVLAERVNGELVEHLAREGALPEVSILGVQQRDDPPLLAGWRSRASASGTARRRLGLWPGQVAHHRAQARAPARPRRSRRFSFRKRSRRRCQKRFMSKRKPGRGRLASSSIEVDRGARSRGSR